MIDGHTSTVGFDTFCPMQMQRYHSDGEIIGTSEYTESMNLFLVAHSQPVRYLERAFIFSPFIPNC
jgi:hypothetical protein